MTEKKYGEACDWLFAEIERSLEVFYISEEINRQAREDHQVLQRLNADAQFWVVQSWCFQTTLFISLGRIFDKRRGSHSIQRILQAAVAHPEYFSKTALLARRGRTAGGGPAPEWLEEFMASAWEPVSADIAKLQDQLKPYEKRFCDVYKPIRDKYYAHQAQDVNPHSLFTPTNRPEVEEMLLFLKTLIGALRQLYDNGTKPILGPLNTDSHAKRESMKSVRGVIGKLIQTP